MVRHRHKSYPRGHRPGAGGGRGSPPSPPPDTEAEPTPLPAPLTTEELEAHAEEQAIATVRAARDIDSTIIGPKGNRHSGRSGRPRTRTRLTNAEREKARRRFLKALEAIPNVVLAAEQSLVGVDTFYVWRSKDPEFAADWSAALAKGIAHLEQEAHRRAVDGISDPVFYKGELIGERRHYSDALLMSMMARYDRSYRRGLQPIDPTAAGAAHTIQQQINVNFTAVTEREAADAYRALLQNTGPTGPALPSGEQMEWMAPPGAERLPAMVPTPDPRPPDALITPDDVLPPLTLDEDDS